MNGKSVSILFVLFLSASQGQTLQYVRGHVQSDVAQIGNDLMVELGDVDRHMPPNRAPVGGDGSFEFRNVSNGRYSLRLTTLYGDTISEQIVDVVGYGSELAIRLPKSTALSNVSGTVSVRELRHPVPQKAFRAFVEAQREAGTGHSEEAIRKLELALRIHPDYADARSNLGVHYVRLGRFPEALQQFEKAIAIGQPSAVLYGNLSFGYIAAGRMRDAEYAARRAVALDSSYLQAHYLLGSVLARTVRPNALEKAPEAARHLRLGAAQVPSAYLEIGQIYLTEGDALGAAEEFRLYLKTGEETNRAKVEKWLAKLR